MPWEKQYKESEVLERAMRAFWAHGYEATSINDLVQATGINRGSLYAAYADKRALFIEALRHYDRHYRIGYLESFAETYGPREAILAVFDGAAKAAFDSSTPGGCLLVNTALELSPHDPEIQSFVQTSLADVETFFRTRIEAAQKEGTVSSDARPAELAKSLLGLFLGLRVLTRSNPDRSTLDAVTKQAEAEDRFQSLLNISKVFGHQPECGMVFADMIMAILKATQRNNCRYCGIQHERLCDMLGMAAEKVTGIVGDKYKTSPHFTEGEMALLDVTVQIGEDASRCRRSSGTACTRIGPNRRSSSTARTSADWRICA